MIAAAFDGQVDERQLRSAVGQEQQGRCQGGVGDVGRRPALQRPVDEDVAQVAGGRLHRQPRHGSVGEHQQQPVGRRPACQHRRPGRQQLFQLLQTVAQPLRPPAAPSPRLVSSPAERLLQRGVGTPVRLFQVSTTIIPEWMLHFCSFRWVRLTFSNRLSADSQNMVAVFQTRRSTVG